MASVAMLCFLWLSLSVCSLVHCVVTTTQSSPADQLTATGTRKCDDGLGAVVAQLVRDQSTMNAKQQVMEVTLAAARTELEATKTKLQATETKLQATETNLNATDTKLQTTETKLQASETRLNATEAKLEATVSTIQNGSGSSFVRWGRKTCPNNTSLVYVGVAGGKQYNQKGGGTNPLCLTRTPQFDNTTKPPYYGHLYGGEYQDIPGHHNHDIPCSVCLAPQSSTIMVPATLTCPPGWTPQYTGHLSSQYKDYYATEYVCLDGSPEDDSSGVRDDNGFMFHYVVTVCGSLPCPPYINDKVVTCVVCSK